MVFSETTEGALRALLPAALGEAAVVVCVRRRCWDWQMEGAARIGLSGGRRRATAAGLCSFLRWRCVPDVGALMTLTLLGLGLRVV